MAIETVAVLSPGEMGDAFGRVLKAAGFDIVTCLAGRSDLTRERASDTGFRDLPDLKSVAAEADLILSIMPPESAPAMATQVARAMMAAGAAPPFIDCNAVSPKTAMEIGEAMAPAGCAYIDGGIIGNPPGMAKPTRLYVSGPDAELAQVIDGPDIDIRQMGPDIGAGSGIKMCYAGITKGTNALHNAVLMAAEQIGVSDELYKEFEYSAGDLYKHMLNTHARLPSVSARFIGEMEEIARTLDEVGVTPDFHKGAAEVFRVMERTPFASETPGTIDRKRTLGDVMKVYVQYLSGKSDKKKASG